MDPLYDDVILTQIRLVDCFIFLLGFGVGQVNVYRHERAVLCDDFTHPVFICKLQTVLREEKGDLGADLRAAAFLDRILRTAVALPVYRLCVLLVGEGVDVYLVRYHEYGVEAESEVTDDLVVRRLILIFIQKIGCAGECDLCDVLLDLCRRHTKTGIDELQRLLLRVDDDLNLLLISIRIFILAHHLKLGQLCDRIASVGDHLTGKDVVVRIQPLFNNRKNIFAVNRKTSCAFTHNEQLLLIFSKKVKRIFAFRFVIWFGNTGADLLPV